MLALHPHLPVDWNEAELDHVRIGSTMYNISYKRAGAGLSIVATGDKPDALCLVAQPDLTSVPACKSALATEHRVTLPLPAIEADLLLSPTAFGDETKQPRVVSEEYASGKTVLGVEALGGSAVRLRVRSNGNHAVKVSEGDLNGDVVSIQMPAGTGWQRMTITLQ